MSFIRNNILKNLVILTYLKYFVNICVVASAILEMGLLFA